MSQPISDIMDSSLKNLRNLVDVNTIIGEPIIVGDTTILPVSKVSFGFASGGSDLPTKQPKEMFGGGAGAGVTIQPLAFLVITNGVAQLLQVEKNPDNTVSNIAGAVPGIIDKISGLMGKDKKDKKSESDEHTGETDQ